MDMNEIGRMVYAFAFNEKNWDKYCPFSETHVKKGGKKFLNELENNLPEDMEIYESIRCQQTDWYFNISTNEGLYSIHLDWWNGYVELSETGFLGNCIITSEK